jgi:hypothetical protein
MPDTAWPESGHPPDSSRADLLHPGFDATLLSNDTSSVIPENEDCAPSSRSPPDASCAPFPHRSPRRSSANAACGGLPPPSAWAATKGQILHLLHSTMLESPYLQTELPSTFVAHVGPQTAWRMATPLPVGLQNSHANGGSDFLIFVADPRTRRLCRTHAGRAETPPTTCGAAAYEPPLTAPLRDTSWRQPRFASPDRGTPPAPQMGPSAGKAAASTVPCGTWPLSLCCGRCDVTPGSEAFSLTAAQLPEPRAHSPPQPW